jgi:hypothetical protein
MNSMKALNICALALSALAVSPTGLAVRVGWVGCCGAVVLVRAAASGVPTASSTRLDGLGVGVGGHVNGGGTLAEVVAVCT